MNQDNKNKNNKNKNKNNGKSVNEELNNENSATRIKKHHCLCCLKEVSGSLRCSQCRTALYCGRECQLKHWPVHKNICQDSNNDDSIEKLKKKAQNHYEQGMYHYFIINNFIIIFNL